MAENEDTHIRVKEKTKEKLDELKINKSEPYDVLINRIIEESIMVRDEYKILKVTPKVVKISKTGRLLFEIPGADKEDISRFKEELRHQIKREKKDKKSTNWIYPDKAKKTIIILGREIKNPKGTYMTYKKEIKGKLREDIMNIPKEKRNKFFDIKSWGKL